MSSTSPKTVKVVREYYRVGGTSEPQYESIGDAVVAAFRLHAESNYYSLTIERVTVHEPYEDGLFGAITETVTGSISIPGRAHYVFRAPELSRYHPNNGWSVPETITVG